MLFQTRKAVYILGCSNMGAYIASAMSKMNYDVHVIDLNPEAFRKLPSDYSGFKDIGDACNIDYLRTHLDKDAFLVLVATASDNTNSFVAQYVKKVLKIETVIARIYDVDMHTLLDNSGIKIIYPSILTATKFFEMLKEIDHEEEK